MEPKPGVTASETAFARGTRDGVVIEWKATPGAEKGRAAMFAAVRAAGAVAIADLLHLPRTAADREYLYRQMPGAATGRSALDEAGRAYTGTDGTITFESIWRGHSGGVNVLMADGSVRFISSSVSSQIWSAMQLGVYGERWEKLPGVKLSGIDGKAPGTINLFSFEFLRELTRAFAPNPRDAESLLTLVSRAKSSARAGDITGAENASKRG